MAEGHPSAAFSIYNTQTHPYPTPATARILRFNPAKTI